MPGNGSQLHFFGDCPPIKMFQLKSQKILWKYFAVLLAINLVIFNWGYITWFFNYNIIGENIGYLTKKVFGQNNFSINVSQVSEKFPSNLSENELAQIQAKPSFIEIPAIKVKAPLIFSNSSSQQAFNAILKSGVLHFPNSSLPGKNGAAIILGHSAPANWPKINYDWVFNDLEKLKPNDYVLISFQGKDYEYKVKKIFWLNKGEDLSPHLTFNESVVVLISCWPPGHNVKRIVVEAELQ